MRNTELSQANERTPVRLGRYELVQKLGAGGMADVFLAHQPGPFSASKLIVIKRLRSGMLDDGQFVQMFADESRIAVRLNHPNVVQTYEAVAEGQDFYLVLEFLDGKSLHQVLNGAKRSQMPLALHLWILTQVLAGLHYAHELQEFDGTSMGIVHRDVSPSNVFATYSGEVKLLDFGIAKSIGASTATREGVMKGKLGYAAPEQCLCREIDRRTDLFAVGVMLWEAIAGTRRPLGDTDASTYQARVQGTELPIEHAAPKAPPALLAICNRALARQPDARYQTALEFRLALEQYLQSIGWKDGNEQLQGFMHEHFSADIETMRRRIDEYLGQSRSMGTNFNAALGQPSLSAAQYMNVGGNSTEVLKRNTVTGLLRRRAGVIISAAGLMGLGIVWLTGGASTKAADPVQLEASVPAGSPASPLLAHGLSGAQSAAQVTVSVTARPDTAEIRLDGRQISNPYRVVHGRDKTLHRLTISCNGHETIEQDLAFDRDIDITVSLKAEPASQKDRAAMRVTPRSVLPRATVQVTKTAPPVSAATPQPGDTLRRAKEVATIDETDPYGR